MVSGIPAFLGLCSFWAALFSANLYPNVTFVRRHSCWCHLHKQSHGNARAVIQVSLSSKDKIFVSPMAPISNQLVQRWVKVVGPPAGDLELPEEGLWHGEHCAGSGVGSCLLPNMEACPCFNAWCSLVVPASCTDSPRQSPSQSLHAKC